MNTLFYGDNLPVLREHIADASVDLIYLDPPFNSNRSYNVLFEDASKSADAQRIIVLSDRGIAEQGTHDELLRLNGAYAGLYNIQ